jgi:hypothetical protein
MPPAPRTSARHRRATDGRFVDAVTRAGSIVTLVAVLVLGGAAGAFAPGAPSDPPTVRVTNAR